MAMNFIIRGCSYFSCVCCALLVSMSSAKRGHLQHSTFMAPQLEVLDPLQKLGSSIEEVLGSGHGVGEDHLNRIQASLAPTWESLPKNKEGLVDQRSLTYAVHRHFMQTRNLMINGLDPARGSEVNLLLEHAPDYVHSILKGEQARSGFSMEDAVVMVSLIEHLIMDSSQELLQHAYESQDRRPNEGLSHDEVFGVMQDYLIEWLLFDDKGALDMVKKDADNIYFFFENWEELAQFLRGRLMTWEHFRERSAHKATSTRSSGVPGWNGMHRRYYYDDALALVSGITDTFGEYVQDECSAVKDMLVKMDRGTTGRVPLSQFHRVAHNGEWRFSESKDYLRQLGSLDESSTWHGPQVIITNYLQSATNCVVGAPHYRICCPNECEELMDSLEASVGASSATAGQLLELVRNLTESDSVERSRLAALEGQLTSIAELHHGQVPLHGRLFAQWLHFAFPHECPFPHRTGTTTDASPTQFGASALANASEIAEHVKWGSQTVQNDTWSRGASMYHNESLWNPEEELLSEHLHLQAPWEFPRFTGVKKLCLGLVMTMPIFAWAWYGSGKPREKVEISRFMTPAKSHVV